MGDFKISASLQGHEEDVKSVAFANSATLLSASRDASVRLWRLVSSNPPAYDCTLSSQSTTFVNSLAYVPPSPKHPEGLVVSGAKDAVIDVRSPSKAPQDNADALLLGHQANVCSLAVDEDGRMIVSGGWDEVARVWRVDEWDSSVVLGGHHGSVWAVLAYDKETIITGCADKMIRVFNPAGKLVRSIRGSEDVVRALCKLPPDHASGAHFASAGNDTAIRFWTLEGRQLGQLYGHENFIYSLAVLPTGELASSSEDRTVRIWRGDRCVQTITHPAISVWCIAACRENGDIATGASDRIVRVFSRSKDRQADGETLKAFEESVKASAIPQQQLGNINKEDLPGPEFLQQKAGTKDGQVKMIRELNGNVSAYQWSVASSQWVQVGTVVDAAGSSGRKITYQGKDYDYVFDVDIEDGKPPLKLPYNLSQNPYEVARKFIEDNELPIGYLDQVANFIVTNTQGATIGQTSGGSQPPGSDPWGTESRYRPGEAGVPAPPQQRTASPPKVLPQTSYLSIATANFKMIQKKIEELSQKLIEQGHKEQSLNPTDLEILRAMIRELEKVSARSDTGSGASNPALENGIDVAVRVATAWPMDKRLPGLDLLRLLVAASPATLKQASSGEKTIVDVLSESGVFSESTPPNNTMLAIRALANIFVTDTGRLVANGEFEKAHKLVHPFVKTATKNRSMIIAITTLYINYAVLLTTPSSHNPDRALTLLSDLTQIINTVIDSEALYRALVGAGTLLTLGEDFRIAAKEVFDFDQALARAEKVGREPRIKNVIQELRQELS